MKNSQKATSGIAEIAAGIGIGLIAGLVGTAVMTAAQMIEMKISGRESSDMPYNMVKKVFGVKAESDEKKELVNNITHIGYGTLWGVPRGVLALSGIDGIAGTVAHFSAVWATELSLLPAMDLSKPVTTWQPKAIGQDALFHGIYALAAGATADILTKSLHKKKEKKWVF